MSTYDNFIVVRKKTLNYPSCFLSFDHSSPVQQRSTLYPKPTPKYSNLNKKQMYHKFQNQKKAEQDFIRLQSHIKYVEEIISRNPHLYSYYYSWMRQAQQMLKQSISVIEAPDNVSFSVTFNYYFIN